MRIAPVLAVLVLAAGCSSAKPAPPSPSAPAAAVSVATTPAPAPAPDAAPKRLPVGATAVLTTPSGPLELTVVSVVDPAKPKESYISPAAGERWVGLKLKFVNKGTRAFVDKPLLGIDAADDKDQPQSSFPDQNVAAGALLDPLYGISVLPGDATVSYLVYSVPIGTRLARFSFTPPGGSSAEWSLG